ncbi:hypothetical protein D7V97_12565 [Corallococcus sp. CA053C]|uniref:hypothetical protein n=1 Tax=Corallococcus sp. CA053C TaxID=2316732 RepID=UPI000EA27F9F|nr:hypothetical protein [Corallococcus sp. CA053C]RKH10960.1 hypothetical protein D7V97_12565 [Corallococcus sp. CA053C]
MPGVLRYRFSNIDMLVDRMFDPQVREPRQYIRAASELQDSDAGEQQIAALWMMERSDLDLMLATLLDGWLNPQDDRGSCPASDRRFLEFVSRYVRENDMTLWVPRLIKKSTFVNVAKGVTYHAPRYRIDEWRQYSLVGPDADTPWVVENVRRLLRLFAAGAHFVVLHNYGDTKIESDDFYGAFGKSFGAWTPWGGMQNTAIGHSHYRHHGSKGPVPSLGTAYAYPYVTGELAPKKDCPFICSLVVDTTDWKNKAIIDGNVEYFDYNTFFQLEGWPGTYVTGKLGLKGRHGRDFDLHQATLWNISTFGLCPYSEKRGTPIFLAPRDHRFQLDSYGMRMPKFAGAREVQTWYRPEALTPAKATIVYAR